MKSKTTAEYRKKRKKKLVSLEASEAWIAWLEGLADHTGYSKSATIEMALGWYAIDRGYGGKQKPKR